MGLGGGLRHGVVYDGLRLPLLGDQLLQHGPPFLLRDGPDLGELLGHVDPQTVEHGLEELKALGLVLVQRIALGVAAEPYDRPQVFQRQQMFAPLGVDGLQQDLLFDLRPKLIGAERLWAFSAIALSRRKPRRGARAQLSWSTPSSSAHSIDGGIQSPSSSCTAANRALARPTGRHRSSAAGTDPPDRPRPAGACPGRSRRYPRTP